MSIVLNFLEYAIEILFLICICVILLVSAIALIALGALCVRNLVDEWRNVDGN